MGKIIIHNRSTEISDEEAVRLVARVIKYGRISNGGKQYCFATHCESSHGEEVWVASGLNEKSDRFTVIGG